MSSTRTLLTALSGIALGVLVGILVAPASGRDTRKKIKRSAIDAKDTLAYRYLQAQDLVATMRKAGSDKSQQPYARTKAGVA